MNDGRVDLEDMLQREWFEDKLKICESKEHLLNDFEWKFIKDLRRRYRTRTDNEEVGFVWNPTVKQYNWLTQIHRKVS